MAIKPPNLGTAGILAGSLINFDNPFIDGIAGYRPGSGYIIATKARDNGNADGATYLRSGLIMAYNSTSKGYGNFNIGTLTSAATSAGTTLAVGTAAAADVLRRGLTSVKVTGPAVANGTVRTLTAAVSGVSGGNLTITAMGVSAVWTLTAPAGQDVGFYQLRVTTPDGVSRTTVSLAANANSATVDAALEALSNVGTGGVVAVYSDPTLTLTFAANLGAVQVEVVSDTTNDGGVFEGGWAAVNTTVGVDGRFIAGSFVSEDGYHTPSTIIKEAVNTVPDSGNLDFPRIPDSGRIDVTSIIDYPTDPALAAWLRTTMSTVDGNKFTFSDRR
jgi:hypothetical protein